MSIAALTAFIAVASRLRDFEDSAPEARIGWNPPVLAFLKGAGALDLLETRDLVHFSSGLGGYWHDLGKGSPDTRFILYDFVSEAPECGSEAMPQWKDRIRRLLESDFYSLVLPLLRRSRGTTVDPDLAHVIAPACAELVLNANTWGKSAAAVGVQRTSAGISVAVADCGRGLVATLSDTSCHADAIPVRDDLQAVLIGPVFNRREFGLWQVIEKITSQRNGWVSIWSVAAELVLRRSNWFTLRELEPESIVDALPLPVAHGPVTPDQERFGYLRSWQNGIRGLRVAFEISFR